MSLTESGQCLYCGSASHWKDICRVYREDKEDGRIQVVQGRIYACVSNIGRRRIKTRVGVPQAECVQEAHAHLNSLRLRVPQSTQPMPFIRGSHLPEQPMVDIPGPRSSSPSTAQPISDSLADETDEELMQLLPEDVRGFFRWLNSRLRAQPSIEERVVLAKLLERFIATGQVPERWYALMAREWSQAFPMPRHGK
jgi:hypothetical protein